MKKLLLFTLSVIFGFSYGQSSFFSPYYNYSETGMTVSIDAPGTIYYTTNDQVPTTNSSSAENHVEISISSNTVFQAFYKTNSGYTSLIERVPYYIGSHNFSKLYFKPPTNWSQNCAYMLAEQPRSLIDYFWPGATMTNECEGWKSVNSLFIKGDVVFNNCNMYYPASLYTPTLSIETTIFYDFSEGYISNPPQCLLATNEASKKDVAVIKIVPNPVSELLKIQTFEKFSEYSLLDVTGKIVKNGLLSSQEINVHQLSKGTYFIKLKGGKNPVIMKFIKK